MLIPLLCGAILGHALPDGFYDRGIQVSVSPDSIHVTYELTASDKTLRQSIARNQYDVQQLHRVIGDGLEFELNGTAQRLDARSVRQEKRHHSRIIFTYELPYNRRDTYAELVLRENNFPGCDGRVRMAVSGRDGVVIKQSTAASIIGRATPHTLTEMSAVERAKVTRLTAILTSPTPTKSRFVGFAIAFVGAMAFAFFIVTFGRHRTMKQALKRI